MSYERNVESYNVSYQITEKKWRKYLNGLGLNDIDQFKLYVAIGIWNGGIKKVDGLGTKRKWGTKKFVNSLLLSGYKRG